MELVTKRFVVKPGAIHVAHDYEFKVGNKQSPFSNGYDMNAVAKELGNKVTQDLSEDDPQYETWAIFKAHELILKQYLRKDHSGQGSLVWGEYEILPSENDRFKKIGNLSSDNDKFILHTKQGVRMWEGNNNKKNGARWPGIKYGLTLSNELFSAAMADNPYAQYFLYEFENEINSIQSYLNDAKTQVETQINELAAAGLSISVIKNDDPVEYTLYSIKGYGFKLVKLLTDYDRFVCAVKTLTTKGMMSNKQGNDILYNGGRMIRKMLNGLYQTMISIRAIKNVKRSSLFDDELRAKLVAATEQEALPVLPMSIWMYEKQPSLLYIPAKMKADELRKLAKILENDKLAN